jgi:hypothetical protein
MTDSTIKTPWHLWLVGVTAVLFNAIDAFDYVMTMAHGESYMASAGMTPTRGLTARSCDLSAGPRFRHARPRLTASRRSVAVVDLHQPA